MGIDRAEARRRVRTITGWAAAGAVALTAAAAFGAARGSHAAHNAAPADPRQAPDPQAVDPYGQQDAQPDQQGFAPPSASTAPPQGMSGGS